MLLYIWAGLAALKAPGAVPSTTLSPQRTERNASAASGETSVEPPLLPGTKRCPDGSILRTLDQCMEMPDHRFAYTHEPFRSVQTRRWWCRGSPKSNEVTVSVEYAQPARRGGSVRQVNHLQRLIIADRPAPIPVKRSVQRQIDTFDRFDTFGGRCQFVRSGATVPVLTLHGVEKKDGKLQWKHEEITLRP